ncbi:MAG: class I SAM-dependent methyltransferase [Rhodobacteraceae bacterium]|nr:class I SAM-dependent methyltransferase [Paracoccaceae bacterium]
MGAAENLKPVINVDQLAPQDIRYIFRALINRAPTPEEVKEWRDKPMAGLRKKLVNSEEFRRVLWQSNTKVVGTHLTAPANNIQIDGPPEQFIRMVDRIKAYWSGRGEIDAEFSVLTNPKFAADNIEKNRKEFYAIGEQDIQTLAAFFKRNNEPLDQVRSAIDFGCGVGRVSAAMARRFDKVIGVDISPGHLRKAETWFESQNLTNGTFVHLSDLDVIETLPEVDLFYSLIVLQHNPPPVMYEMLKRLLRRVRNGGYALFQLPTYCSDYSFIWDEYFTTEPKMEMHSLPQRYVFEALQSAGYRVIECHQDRRASAKHMSHTFFAQRSQMV